MRVRWSAISVPSLVLSLAACNVTTGDDASTSAPPGADPPAASPADPGAPSSEPGKPPAPAADEGAVFTISNASEANEVLAFARDASGKLSPAGVFPTGGRGLGKGLGSQGALALSEDRRVLVVVDAGSSQISSFRVQGTTLLFRSRVSSGGTQPISVTVHGGVVYALNAGEPSNVSGFLLDADGRLAPIAGSTRALSGSNTAPAQVQFSPKGDLLLVAERNTQTIDAFLVGADGLASGPIANHSAGAVPFGFAFGKRGQVFFSEAGPNAASSYAVAADGTLTVVTGSAPTYQGAPCWLVVTNDGRYAYTGNAGGNSITGFAIGVDGALTLLNADGHTAATGAGATDLALSVNSQYLYVRNTRAGSVSAFAVNADGSLSEIPGADGLPGGSAGLAAY